MRIVRTFIADMVLSKYGVRKLAPDLLPIENRVKSNGWALWQAALLQCYIATLLHCYITSVLLCYFATLLHYATLLDCVPSGKIHIAQLKCTPDTFKTLEQWTRRKGTEEHCSKTNTMTLYNVQEQRPTSHCSTRIRISKNQHSWQK